MDFSKVKVEGAERAKKSKPVSVVHVDMHEFKIAGVPLEVKIQPAVGETWEQQARAWRAKWKATRQVSDHLDSSDADLAEMSEREEGAHIELFARSLAGWNIVDGDSPVPCELDARCAMFKAFPAILEAYILEFQRVTKEAGNANKP